MLLSSMESYNNSWLDDDLFQNLQKAGSAVKSNNILMKVKKV